ncbi:hypothetical protein FOZ76_23665 [Verticiella sediminum]|uniref:Uncharacterized protein n=1 Tax=Verticiella sediminum TaxID=1247510 RepID=A0A556A8Z5_9BURK|nr:hypothetical protein [Verticiella sediminum]TSH89359.1 hypothetical protein FOZ76_23665 [Verticiella sediminum]
MATNRKGASPAAVDAAKDSGPAANEGRVLPSGGPVEVPRVPMPENAKDDVAGKQSHPRADESGGTSWADNALPAPNKKTVRSNPY